MNKTAFYNVKMSTEVITILNNKISVVSFTNFFSFFPHLLRNFPRMFTR